MSSEISLGVGAGGGGITGRERGERSRVGGGCGLGWMVGGRGRSETERSEKRINQKVQGVGCVVYMPTHALQTRLVTFC